MEEESCDQQGKGRALWSYPCRTIPQLSIVASDGLSVCMAPTLTACHGTTRGRKPNHVPELGGGGVKGE